jgi:1-acyl-sn-glycerol-3-phosphate acyltransferase
MKVLRAAWRLARGLSHAVGGWWTITMVFPKLQPHERHERVNAWAARMLDLLGIELRVHGTPPASGPVLLVANHISWLDILVMHAAHYCRFVSKSEVRHWPLIGTLATGAGTLYIERESRRDAMRVVHKMTESLRAGDVVAVFPEGTTSDGRELLPFHGNLIQAAISANAPALPVALKFVDSKTGGQASGPSFVGDETLLGSIWRTLASDTIVADVRFGQPQYFEGRDRRAWAADLQTAVDALRGS